MVGSAAVKIIIVTITSNFITITSILITITINKWCKLLIIILNHNKADDDDYDEDDDDDDDDDEDDDDDDDDDEDYKCKLHQCHSIEKGLKAKALSMLTKPWAAPNFFHQFRLDLNLIFTEMIKYRNLI